MGASIPAPVGERFGKLVVLGIAPSVSAAQRKYACKCDCGTTKDIRRTHLLSGATTSCGCGLITHGLMRGWKSRTNPLRSEIRALHMMRQRCENPRANAYKNYGGRGIKVCARWAESIAAFIADMGPKPSPAHSIERINNDGDYEPGNCRWATHTEQQRNRTDTRLSMPIARSIRRTRRLTAAKARELADRYGASVSTIYSAWSGRTWAE
jgi:hypothetical protein